MNIYNTSQYNTQASLPATATFSKVISNDYVINGASAGDILYTNGAGEINGLLIGPQNYILQSSGTTPQWSNSLVLNTVQTTSLKIPGTSVGDLFTVDGNNTFIRIPIGATNSTLMSVGGTAQWASKIYYYNAGANNNIPTIAGDIFTNTFTLSAGVHKISISGNVRQTGQSALNLKINGSNVLQLNYTADCDMSRNYIANFTAGTYTFVINGLGTDSNGSIFEYLITAERF